MLEKIFQFFDSDNSKNLRYLAQRYSYPYRTEAQFCPNALKRLAHPNLKICRNSLKTL